MLSWCALQSVSTSLFLTCVPAAVICHTTQSLHLQILSHKGPNSQPLRPKECRGRHAKPPVFEVQMTLSYNMHVWPWSVAMSDSSNLVRGALYIVFCSFNVKNTHWTKGWKCLWRGHSVNQNQPLLSLSLSLSLSLFAHRQGVVQPEAVQVDGILAPASAPASPSKTLVACVPPPPVSTPPRVHPPPPKISWNCRTLLHMHTKTCICRAL